MSGSLIGDHVVELTRQVDAQRHRIGQLTSDLRAAELLIEGLNDEIKSNRRAIDHKNHLLEARDSEISRLRRQVCDLEAANERARSSLAGMADLFGCTPNLTEGAADGYP